MQTKKLCCSVACLLTIYAMTCALTTIPLLQVAADETTEENPLAQYYGFQDLEVYKLDSRVGSLIGGDFNSDGLQDVIVVDNKASCLRFLVQLAPGEIQKKRGARRVNDLESDSRFDIRQIAMDKQIAGLAAADFNGDGKLDLATIGVPDQLAIRYQPENNDEWSKKWTVRLPGLKPSSWMIAAGDLNGDKRADLAVLAEEVTYLIYQKADGEMDSPEKLINTSGQLEMIQISDINGDGRSDLTYVANEGSTRGLCARLQTSDGRLGPELSFDLQQPRSVTLANVDQRPGTEILTIEQRTGRVVVSSLKPQSSEKGSLAERMVNYGIGPATGAKNRAIAVGDVTGDQLSDVVVADPEQAQLLLYRQNGIDGLGTAEVFPGLLGVRDLCLADINGDGVNEVIMLSEKEGVIATSQFANGRLTFPEVRIRKPSGEFAAIEVLAGSNSKQIICVVVRGSGRAAVLEFKRAAITPETTWNFVDEKSVELSGVLGSRGVDLLLMDSNGDKLADLMVVPNGTSEMGTQIVQQQPDGALTASPKKSELDLGAGSAASLFPSGDRLLVARESFARAMTYSNGSWKVADQFNAGESSARIDGVAALNLDGEAGDEIVLVDSGVRKLRVLRVEDGLYRPWKEVELGGLGFAGSLVADLNGDQLVDLLLSGSQYFSVLYAGRVDFTMEEVASYESKRDDSYPADIIAGDLNGDNTIDLTAIDTSIDGIEILRFFDSKIDPVTHFRVFEEKRLVSESEDRGTEPREGLIIDVTGDGRNDLLLLCHDRLLVYPQDPGN